LAQLYIAWVCNVRALREWGSCELPGWEQS